MFEIVNLNIQFQEKKIISNLNMTLPNNGMVFINGESGIGKTTFINVIAGALKPSGQLLYNGIDIYKDKNYAEDYRNQMVSIMQQRVDLFDELTIKENYMIKSEILNLPDFNAFIILLKKFNLQYLDNQKVGTLSGGERKRLDYCFSLIKPSKIIIADELLSQLDENNRLIVINSLKEVSKEKLVLIVSHDKTFTDSYADEIIYVTDKGWSKKIINELNYDNKDNKMEKEKSLSIKTKCLLAKLLLKSEIKPLVIFEIIFCLFVLLLSFVFECLYYSYGEKYYLDLKQSNQNVVEYVLKEDNSNVNISDVLKNKNINSNCIYYTEDFLEKNISIIEITNIDVYKYTLIDGKLPENNNELLITSSLMDLYLNEGKTKDNIIGNSIDIELSNYIITGIIDFNSSIIESSFVAISEISLSNVIYTRYISSIYNTDFINNINKLGYDIKIDNKLDSEEQVIYDIKEEMTLILYIFIGILFFMLCFSMIIYLFLEITELKKISSSLFYSGAYQNDVLSIYIGSITVVSLMSLVLANVLLPIVNVITNKALVHKLELECISEVINYSGYAIFIGVALLLIQTIVVYFYLKVKLSKNIYELRK